MTLPARKLQMCCAYKLNAAAVCVKLRTMSKLQEFTSIFHHMG
jgi:hypothetical protein